MPFVRFIVSALCSGTKLMGTFVNNLPWEAASWNEVILWFGSEVNFYELL